MLYTLIIREEALEEMKDAYLYYERAQSGLGERFLSELQKDMMKFWNILNFMDLLMPPKRSVM